MQNCVELELGLWSQTCVNTYVDLDKSFNQSLNFPICKIGINIHLSWLF
jgi:hypothetical protein